MRILVLVLVAMVADLAPTAVVADPAIDDLVVIVHVDNHVAKIDLEAVFLRTQRRWPGGELAIPLNFAPDNKRRRQFDRVVLEMSADEVARYWLDQRIRSGLSAPREIADAELAANLVAHLAGAIAYVPATTNVRAVRVIARIHAGKLTPP